MAAGFLRELAGDAVQVYSGGTQPADSVNPVAVAAMAEVGIDISRNIPDKLFPVTVQDSDVVITMGGGDDCPFYPGKRYEDWKLEDPAGQGIESVRVIRDDIRARVQELIGSLNVQA